MTITDENCEKTIVCSAEEYCGTEMDIYDPDEIPWEVAEMMPLTVSGINLGKFNRENTIEELKELLLKPFGLDKPFANEEYDDDEYEFEDEAAKEIIEALHGRFDEMVTLCNELIDEHASGGKEIKTLKVEATFGGRGDMIAGPDEILQEIFGYENGQNIFDAIDKNDDEDAMEKLTEMECMKNVTEESLEGLISFIREFDYAPGECTFTQTTMDDGKIEIQVDFE